MASIIDDLMNRLAGAGLSQVSRELGTDTATTANAVTSALPVLLSALARNARSDDGAASLAAALQRDHDGSILNDVPAAVSQYQSGDGASILQHIFKGQSNAVATGLGQASGLQPDKATALLTMLAPLVMGALGMAQRTENLDATGVASILGQEHASLPPTTAGLGGMLGLLDANRDGSVVDDIGGLASQIFRPSPGTPETKPQTDMS